MDAKYSGEVYSLVLYPQWATAPSQDSMSSPFGPFTCTAQLGRVVMDRLSGEGLFDERPMTQLGLGRFRFGRCLPLAQLEPLTTSDKQMIDTEAFQSPKQLGKTQSWTSAPEGDFHDAVLAARRKACPDTKQAFFRKLLKHCPTAYLRAIPVARREFTHAMMPLAGRILLGLAMKTPGPIFVTELFPKLNAELQELLGSLDDEDWSRPATGAWSVKDVVGAHLLDTTLRRLAVDRDQYVSPDTPKLETDRDLTNYINQTNAEWVKAARRLSPRLLIELLEKTGQEMYEFFKTLDPYKPAVFPVNWAGEQVSPNWFDIAREYTEKWHHQEQIREAVYRPGLTSREYLFPVLVVCRRVNVTS